MCMCVAVMIGMYANVYASFSVTTCNVLYAMCSWCGADELVIGPNSAIGASVSGCSHLIWERNIVFLPTSQPHDLPDYVVPCEKQRYSKM